MTNIQGRSQRHCDGRSKLDARVYRSSFKPRQAPIFEIPMEKRSDLACESDDAHQASGDSLSNNCSLEQPRSDIGTEQEPESSPCQGELDQSQHVSSAPETSPRSTRRDGLSSGKEEDLAVGVNGVGTALERATSSLQDSLAAGDDILRFKEYWVPVPLSEFQLEQYCSVLTANSTVLCSTSRNDTLDRLKYILNALKKCCDHPYVLDSSLQASAFGISNDALKAGIEASGKIQLLSKLLPDIKDKQLKVLILYKTMVAEKNSIKLGDILDDFICRSFGTDAYIHIYGGGYLGSKKLQADLDLFNRTNNEKFVVLVEHSRSFRGVKLSSVDLVIMFNSSWNLGNDIRALQQMTFETKSNHIRVLRLYSLSTLEEKSMVLAKKGKPVTSMTRNVSHQLLMWGVTRLFNKLDQFHGSDASKLACLKTELLQSLLHEVSIIMSSCSNDYSISLISHMKTGADGHYENMWLYDEPKNQSSDDEVPHLFWLGVLQDKSPQWRLLPKLSETRKRRMLSSTFGKVSTSEDVPSRKRCNVSRCSEESLSPTQRQGEQENGEAPISSDKLTGSSQDNYNNDVMPSSSSKIDLINSDSASNSLFSADLGGKIGEICKERKTGKNDKKALIQEQLTVKEKRKIPEERHHFRSKVISNLCGEMAKEEELKKSDKESQNEQKHELDKCMHEDDTTGSIHLGQISISIVPVTLKEPDSLPVCGPIMESEAGLGSKSDDRDRDNAISGAKPSSKPINSGVRSQEIILEKKAGLCDVAIVSPFKRSSIQRDVIHLDSDEEQIGEPESSMNLANTQEKEAELLTDLLEVEVMVQSSTKLSLPVCNEQTKVLDNSYEHLKHTTGLVTGEEQLSHMSLTNLGATEKITPPVHEVDDKMGTRPEEDPDTSIGHTHRASSVLPSAGYIPPVPLGINQSQDGENYLNAEGSPKKQDMVNAPLELLASTGTGSCTPVDQGMCVNKDKLLTLEQVGTINSLEADDGSVEISSSKPTSRKSQVDKSKQQLDEAAGPSLQAQSGSSGSPFSRADIQPICEGGGNGYTGLDLVSPVTCPVIGENFLQLGSRLRTNNSADAVGDLLLFDAERIQKEQIEIEKNHEGLVMRIKSEYEKELVELKRHFETLVQKANVEVLRKRTELREYRDKACANQLLAAALREANNMERWWEVPQENSSASIVLPSLLPAPAPHSPQLNFTGGALVWTSNVLTEPILPHYAGSSQNANMLHHYGNRPPVYGMLVPYVPSLGQSGVLRPGFPRPSPGVVMGGQAYSSTRGSLTHLHHQPYVVGGIGEFPAIYRPW